MNRSYLRGPLYTIANAVRVRVVRAIRPVGSYFLFSSPKRSLQPLSKIYGYDRGKPIDRYYIEIFLRENKDWVKGVCLEITDTQYIKKYGGDRVTKADALDIDRANHNATIYGDLRKLDGVPSNKYDCLIITQTLVMIDDYEAAIKECKRILKPGGTMLVTLPCLSPVWNIKNHHWRFTGASAKYVFGKYFAPENLEIKTFGNALSGQAFWVGMSQQDLSKEEIEYNDPYFPVIVSIKATKSLIRPAKHKL